MTEDWKIQASLKLGEFKEHMVNVRASSVNELLAFLDELHGSRGFLNNTVEGIAKDSAPVFEAQAVANVQNQFPQAQQVQPGVVTPYPQAPQTYGNKPEPPVCVHGPMKFYQGKGKNGPYSAYFCPAPKGPGQCAPKFVD